MSFVPAREKFERQVAAMAGPQREVRSLANRIHARAAANLRAHRDENESRVELVRAPKKLDWLVVLVDDGGAAGAIERGGTRRNGTPFEGLHVLGRAVSGV